MWSLIIGSIFQFSISFDVAIQHFDVGIGDVDCVSVHVKILFDEITESNLVKFTRIKGEREPFMKVMQILEISAGEFLPGLSKKNANIALDKFESTQMKALYLMCFSNQ